MPVTLSTGQEYNPKIRDSLKNTLSPETVKKGISGAVSRVGSSVRYGTAMGAASLLDTFIGEWAGNWAASKAVKAEKKKGENSLKVSDYIKIVRSELRSILSSKSSPEETVRDRKTSDQPAAPEVAPVNSSPAPVSRVESLEALGVMNQDQLEAFIKEIRLASEDELLKHISENQIESDEVLTMLVEANDAANKEIASSLKKQFAKERMNPDSRNIERMAESLEKIEKVLVRGPQDVYGANVQPTEVVSGVPVKEDDSKSGLFGLVGLIGSLGGFLENFKTMAMGIISAAAGVAGIKAIPGLSRPEKVKGGAIKSGIGGKLMKGGLLGAAASIGGEYALEKTFGEDSAVTQYGSSAINGAAVGATVGSVIPVVGTALGAAIGGIGGLAYEALGDKKLVEKVKSLFSKPETDPNPMKVVPSAKESAQQEQTRKLFAESSKLSEQKTKTEAAPVIVNAPTVNAPAGGASQSTIANFGSTNNDPAFRRLGDRNFALSFI